MNFIDIQENITSKLSYKYGPEKNVNFPTLFVLTSIIIRANLMGI